jgi:hypothetical protein
MSLHRPVGRPGFALTLSMRAIRHRDGLGAFDEHKSGIADDAHTSGGRQSLLQHTHFRAVGCDRQFGEASLALGLYQRLSTHGSQPIRSIQRH